MTFESRLKNLEQQFYLPVTDFCSDGPFRIYLKTIADVQRFDNELSDFEYMNKVVSITKQNQFGNLNLHSPPFPHPCGIEEINGIFRWS